MNEAADNLIDKLQREACDTGKVYDIFQDLTLSSLDIICSKFYDTVVDFQKKKQIYAKSFLYSFGLICIQDVLVNRYILGNSVL